MLYEINTRAWLRELSEKAGEKITLANIPDEEIGRWKDLGFTHIWLMGLWTTGPKAREIALNFWREEWSREIPSSAEDVCGSPYAIQEYAVDPNLGDPLTLVLLRERLRGEGIKLIADFVPNHWGVDSRELYHNPGRFIQGEPTQAAVFEAETRFGVRSFAHGRDPYFPPWIDTVQMDYRAAETHNAMCALAQTLSAMSDGLRCDMAMLVLPDIFNETWREFPPRSLSGMGANFWRFAIPRIKQTNPHADLIAEVYWEREMELQACGFDYTYNKRVTDMLQRGEIPQLKKFLAESTSGYLSRSVHFLENHDEPRAAATLPLDLHKAAALLICALPGLPLLHDGQLEGRKKFARIQMTCRAPEPVDPEIARFYESMLRAFRKHQVRSGRGSIFPLIPHGPAESLLGIRWEGAEHAWLAVINLGQEVAECLLPAVNPDPIFATHPEKLSFNSMGNQTLLHAPPRTGFIFQLASS